MSLLSTSAAGYAWCAVAALASALATFLIKHGTVVAPGWNLVRLLWLGAAVGSYGFGFVCYSLALQRLPISLAYPLMTAVTMAVITAVGVMVWHESLTLMKCAGLVLLAVSAFLLTR